jgi:lysophospholipase L1-like esterase
VQPPCVAVLLAAVFALTSPVSAREYRVADVVGDSVSEGVNPDAYLPVFQFYGWVHMLYGLRGYASPPAQWAITNLWPGIRAYNSARSGSKAWEWADTNRYAYLAGVRSHGPDLVFVMIGGNDFLAYSSDGLVTEQETAQYVANLNTIVRALRASTPAPDIVLIGYYDLFDGCSANTGLPQYRPMSEAVVEANRLIRTVADSSGCFFLDVREAFLHHGYGAAYGDANHQQPDYVSAILFDIHPVTAGHRKICELVYGRLSEMKGIPRFIGIDPGPSGISLRWSSGYGQRYALEAADGLSGVSPFSQVAICTASPPWNIFGCAPVPDGPRFYRVRVLE